jgi:hypothetical protein
MPKKIHEFKFRDNMIPKITKEELERRMKFISPCSQKEHKIILMKDYGDPIKQSFSWSFKDGEALGTVSYDGIHKKDRPAENGGWYLKKIADTSRICILWIL